jgi:hypothetical protein
VSTGQRIRRSSGAVRPARRSGGIPTSVGASATATAPVSDDLAAALADVVGTEPSPTRPHAAFRTARPGLGPLSVLRIVVLRSARQMHSDRMPTERAIGDLKRRIRHLLPSDTPDWTAYLLLEEVARWVADAYLHSEHDGEAA